MMLRDVSDIQATTRANTRPEAAETSSKPQRERMERSGNEPRAAAPEAAPWYIANNVSTFLVTTL